MMTPFRSTMLKSVPDARLTPSDDSGSVPVSPVRLTTTPSVSPRPSPLFSRSTNVPGLSPVKPEASMTFAPEPPVSLADSTLVSVSSSAPALSDVFVSVKLTSRDSIRMS